MGCGSTEDSQHQVQHLSPRRSLPSPYKVPCLQGARPFACANVSRDKGGSNIVTKPNRRRLTLAPSLVIVEQQNTPKECASGCAWEEVESSEELRENRRLEEERNGIERKNSKSSQDPLQGL